MNQKVAIFDHFERSGQVTNFLLMVSITSHDYIHTIVVSFPFCDRKVMLPLLPKLPVELIRLRSWGDSRNDGDVTRPAV